MDQKKRRRGQTKAQQKIDKKNRELGVPSTTNIQQSLYRIIQKYSEIAIADNNPTLARSVCRIITQVEKSMKQETTSREDAEENLRDVTAVKRWAPEKVDSKLRTAFRIDELEALVKTAKENEAKSQSSDT